MNSENKTLSTAELLRRANNIVCRLEENEGEIDGLIEASIFAFANAVENKNAALRAVALQAEVQSSMIDDEIKRLRRLKQHYDRIKKTAHDRALAIALAAEQAGSDPNEKGVARLKSSVRADFPADAEKWPKEFVREQTSVRLDRAGLKKAIQNGEVEAPEGFRLTTRRYVKFDGVNTPRD